MVCGVLVASGLAASAAWAQEPAPAAVGATNYLLTCMGVTGVEDLVSFLSRHIRQNERQAVARQS